MFLRLLVLPALALLFLQNHVCLAQNEFERGLEKFFQSRKLIETLSIQNDGKFLCSDCLAKIDRIVPKLKDNPADKLIRIEGVGGQEVDISTTFDMAKLVHDYLRDQYEIKASLYLTGYSKDSIHNDAFRVEIVSYDRILPVDDAVVETVIIR